MGTAERLLTKADDLTQQLAQLDACIEVTRASLHLGESYRRRYRGLTAKRAALAEQLHLHQIAL